MTTEDQWNQINGGQSSLGEGTFKRRDELRRVENMQRQKVKVGERIDRNISRAVRNGDARSAEAFNNLRTSINGQGFQGGNGITNSNDREERVRDGALKGAKIRHDMGNIGATNNGPIAEAPPADSVTPKIRDRSPEFTDSIPNSLNQSSNGGESSDVIGNASGTAPENIQTEPMAPRSQTDIGGLNAKRGAVAKLRDKWTSQNKANDTNSLVDDYEAKNGNAVDQTKPYYEKFGPSDAKVDEAIAGLDTTKFSPEQIVSIRKNMAKLSPQERKDAVQKTEDSSSQKALESTNGKTPSVLPTGDDFKTRVNNLGRNINESLDRGRKSLSDYDKIEADRIAKREAGFAAIDEKLKNKLVNADAALVVEQKQSRDYFSDLEKNSYYNSSLGWIKRGFMDERADPAPPVPVDYDTFDRNSPNMGQKQPLYQSAYGGRNDTYSSFGVNKDAKGNSDFVIRENESYYGPTRGLKFSKDEEGNRNIEGAGLKPGAKRPVNGNLHEYRKALDDYFKPSSNSVPR